MATIEEVCNQVSGCNLGFVSDLRHQDGDLLVRVDCNSFSDPDVRKTYVIRCSTVPESSIVPGRCAEVRISSDHCLLWTYHCEAAYLHFTSSPANPFEIVGMLYEAHEELFRGWRPLTRFLNPSLFGGLHGLLERGSGMLAQGPRPVMESYALAIGDRMKLNVNSAHDSRYNSTMPYKALTIDEGYVICREIAVAEDD